MEPEFCALAGLVLANKDGMRDGQQTNESPVFQIVEDFSFCFDITGCENREKRCTVCVCGGGGGAKS